MKNVNYIKTSVAFRLLLAILCIGFVLFLSSCQNNAKNDVVYMTTSSSQSRGLPSNSETSSNEGTESIGMPNDLASQSTDLLSYFDYKKIGIDVTSSIGVKIKNCNIILDYFGNLLVLGEVSNISSVIKTNMILTFDFYDKKNDLLFSDNIIIQTNYLRPGATVPFIYSVKDSTQYININNVKIGINYKDYYKLLQSNVVVRKEKTSYEDNMIKISGKLVNIGENKAKNIVLLCTFYDEKDKVVFIKKCYIPKQELSPKEEEDFLLEVLFSKFGSKFTHYNFEVFFEDSVEMP
jgi:hypothetical protein